MDGTCLEQSELAIREQNPCGNKLKTSLKVHKKKNRNHLFKYGSKK